MAEGNSGAVTVRGYMIRAGMSPDAVDHRLAAGHVVVGPDHRREHGDYVLKPGETPVLLPY